MDIEHQSANDAPAVSEQSTAPSPYQWLIAKQQRAPVENYERMYRISEVSRILGVCPTTVRRWVKRNLKSAGSTSVSSIRTGPRGWHRFSESMVRKMRGEMQERA